VFVRSIVYTYIGGRGGWSGGTYIYPGDGSDAHVWVGKGEVAPGYVQYTLDVNQWIAVNAAIRVQHGMSPHRFEEEPPWCGGSTDWGYWYFRPVP
jgi:hypothetical protein